MIKTLIDLPRTGRTTGDLTLLQSLLVEQLVGEPFLFVRVSYADELVLHFGLPREYTLPRFGKRIEGSVILRVRGSAWILKSGSVPLAAWSGRPPEGFPEPAGEPLDKGRLEAGGLVTNQACVVAVGVFHLVEVNGYGLKVLLSDDSRLTVFPTPPEPLQPGDEELPELADWEIVNTFGVLKVGPGIMWEYDATEAPQGGLSA